MDRPTRIVWIFATAGLTCGASTFAFMISPLYRGPLLCAPGVIWSVFSCLALRAGSELTGLVVRPSFKRVLLGALAPVVAYSLAGLAGLAMLALGDAAALGRHGNNVLLVSIPLIMFTAGIAVMLRVWSRRLDTRTCGELAGAGLIVLVLNGVLEVFDQPAFGAHSFQLVVLVSVATLLFVAIGRGVARSSLLGDVPA